MSTHEPADTRTEVKMGSERAFGIVFAVVFAVIALWPLLGGGGLRLWAAAICAGFLAAAFAAPRALKPLNVLWFRFGMLLHRIVSPIVMGFLFFVTVTPIGLLMRAFGKDPMRLKRSEAKSYWIERDPPGPPPESMTKQF
ncbi:MAG: hypothetical protein EA385_04310 [Salinarimonadaceae bacterium]|nr:MAG: hypothetical protein EA385_04310 [Salinarimonadaceae bacterium]